MIRQPQDEPIVPLEGLAGVLLGWSRRQVEAKIGKPERATEEHKPEYSRTLLFYKAFHVYLENDAVYVLYAEVGYRGTTPEGVRAGATWGELIRVYPGVIFSEEEDVWYVPGIDGLGFLISRPPRPREQPVNPPWVREMYFIQDPERAFIDAIEVSDIRYETSAEEADANRSSSKENDT